MPLKLHTSQYQIQWRIASATLLIGLYTLWSTNLHAKESVSVGVVNVAFLMENAPQSEIATIKLKKQFSPQEKALAQGQSEINALERELNKIKVEKKSVELQRQKERQLRSRKRAHSRALQDFREELRFSRDAALDGVQKEVFKAIDEVREQKKIDIILQDYISASQRVDITAAVLKHLKSKLTDPKASSEQTEKTKQ